MGSRFTRSQGWSASSAPPASVSVFWATPPGANHCQAAVLVGSLGMLPSASLGAGPGLFEPIHGSAPGIAGQGIANPIGAIASVAMLLRYGLKLAEPADAVEAAIRAVLDAGGRTKDIAGPGEKVLGTREMGERIAELVNSTPQPRSPSPRRGEGVRG